MACHLYCMLQHNLLVLSAIYLRAIMSIRLRIRFIVSFYPCIRSGALTSMFFVLLFYMGLF